jgi:hypothetical protein
LELVPFAGLDILDRKTIIGSYPQKIDTTASQVQREWALNLTFDQWGKSPASQNGRQKPTWIIFPKKVDAVHHFQSGRLFESKIRHELLYPPSLGYIFQAKAGLCQIGTIWVRNFFRGRIFFLRNKARRIFTVIRVQQGSSREHATMTIPGPKSPDSISACKEGHFQDNADPAGLSY